MGLFSGLEKFGIKLPKGDGIFEEEKTKQPSGIQDSATITVKEVEEKELILNKEIICRVCEKKFTTKIVKNGKVQRLEPDADLRPRYKHIDVLKYDITACPHCGYTALNSEFPNLMPAQEKFIKESICASFQASEKPMEDVYTYEEALDRNKLAILNSMVKKGKLSERAYLCLKTGWLIRGQAEALDTTMENYEEVKEQLKQEEDEFLLQAYDGFMMATAKENFPMCGMDESTIEFLITVLAWRFKKYDVASKCIGMILSSASASRRIKDKALLLKETIIKEIRAGKTGE